MTLPSSFSDHPPPYTLITAVSYENMCALENLLYTLYDYRAHVSNFPRVVVYNLGVNRTNQLDVLDQLYSNGLMDELIPFDYEQYPASWDISEKNNGKYEWKTAMMYEQSLRKEGNGLLVWMDASNKVTLKFLHHLPNYIANGNGFWAPRGGHRHSSPIQPAFLCNDAVFGFDGHDPSIFNAIIEPWYRCSLDQNCIETPTDSNLHKHQIALTDLVYKSGRMCDQSPRFFKIRTHRDMACKATLFERDNQGLLYHPSTLDHAPWSPFDIMDHSLWRYPSPISIPSHHQPFLHLQLEDTNEEGE
ncbi:hypothetical protein BC941DRAFT_466682 [Chlamydoabsidia padenii]|nr:hypothetical protein BC941DRAFT_466682 [Chlamydoabsidia padenii]